MNELVLVSQKNAKSLWTKENAGLFSGAEFFRQVFLNPKSSVQRRKLFPRIAAQ